MLGHQRVRKAFLVTAELRKAPYYTLIWLKTHGVLDYSVFTKGYSARFELVGADLGQ